MNEQEHTKEEWAKHVAESRTGCATQCDGCHTYEECTPGNYRLGDLLLCGDCYGKGR